MDGVVLRYQDPRTETYLGSPSLVRAPDGALVASHDYFGPGCPLNHEGEEHLSSLYRSTDDGTTWSNVGHIAGAFWHNLFVHDGALCFLGASQQNGSIVIRRSDDSGFTWTRPVDADSGLLFRGGSRQQPPNYHCAPMPMLVDGGRLYRAFEDCTPLAWPSGFQALVISAPVDADLLRAESWTMSEKLPFDPAWVPEGWGALENPGWLEGNVVRAPDGALYDVLRFNSIPLVDRAAMVRIHDDGARLSFDPATGFIDLPGGMTKFTIRHDPVSGRYLTLSNNNTDPAWPNQRNVLSLCASGDLVHWEHVTALLEPDPSLEYEFAMRTVGYQYVDWQFDGDDIIYLVRMADAQAHNYHDANQTVFMRLRGFRGLLP